MKDHAHMLQWATACLTTKGDSLKNSFEIVVETPWSTVVRLSTLKQDIYLKQTPAPLFLEPRIMQLLRDQFHASVPSVIAIHDDLHCFLMEGAGQTLRAYLKNSRQPELLCEAIQQYTTLQRSIENHVEPFLALDVPDWRLDNIPHLYDQIINQTELLKAESLTDQELQLLRALSPKIATQCEQLSHYKIKETLVQPDFTTNNILFDPILKKMTFIDLGEIVIAHPFFSLHQFVLQATLYHDVKEVDHLYHQLQESCFESWLELATKKQLAEAFRLIKNLFPIYSALAFYRLMMSVDLTALQSFYAHRPNRLAGYFREYIASAD